MLIVDVFGNDAFSWAGRIGERSPLRVYKSAQYFLSSCQMEPDPAVGDGDTLGRVKAPAIARRVQVQNSPVAKVVDSCIHFGRSGLQFSL